MNQVTVADAPTPKLAMHSVAVEPSAQDAGPPEDWPDISVLLQGNRLQITANVDAKGLQTLKEMIGKYEEILKLFSKPMSEALASRKRPSVSEHIHADDDEAAN